MVAFSDFKVLDLTHTVRPDIPSGVDQSPFASEMVSDYDNVARQHVYHIAGKAGTHMDSPCHFIPGGNDIATVDPSTFIRPLIVLHQPLPSNGFATADHLRTFEAERGSIPSGSIVVLNSGWWHKWSDIAAYRNPDASGRCENPGFSLDAAELLAERGVVGVGVDTINVDGSNANSPFHKFWLARGLFIMENLTNLDTLPPTGALGIFLPLKIEGGSESPIRALALLSP